MRKLDINRICNATTSELVVLAIFLTTHLPIRQEDYLWEGRGLSSFENDQVHLLFENIPGCLSFWKKFWVCLHFCKYSRLSPVWKIFEGIFCFKNIWGCPTFKNPHLQAGIWFGVETWQQQFYIESFVLKRPSLYHPFYRVLYSPYHH